MKTIGELARDFRLSKGWTTTRMGKEVGTSRQSIENLEAAGNRQPRYIKELAVVMETTVDNLMGVSGAANGLLTFAGNSAGETKQNQAIAPADIAPVATNSVAGKTLSVYAHALGLMFDALPDDKILRSKVYARLTATIYEVIDPAEPEPQPEPAAAAHPKKLTA